MNRPDCRTISSGIPKRMTLGIWRKDECGPGDVGAGWEMWFDVLSILELVLFSKVENVHDMIFLKIIHVANPEPVQENPSW